MEQNQGMPVYVKIEEYKDVVDVIELIQEKLKESKGILNKINQLKNQEDAELEQWQNELEDIENRMDYVDKSLFPPESY